MTSTPLKSHESGVTHWKHQRLTACFLLLLIPYCLFHFVTLYHQPLDYALIWLRHPVHATLVSLTIWIMLYHSYLGLSMIVEDYIHCNCMKRVSSFFILGTHLFAGVLTLFIFISRS